MVMNRKENYLAAVRYGSPEYVPRTNEGYGFRFQLEGNLRHENWTDNWGVFWEVGLAETVPFPKGNPISDPEMIPDFAIPDPDRLVYTEAQQEALRSVDRADTLVVGDLSYLLFERAWALMGLENFLVAMVTHPQDVKLLLHRIAEYDRAVFARYLDLGADVIGFSEDLGSQRALMVSPAMFREFLLPEYEFIFEPIQRAGRIVSFHSCGCVQDIVDDLAGIGVTSLNPVQYRANDIRRIKSVSSNRMALQGAIDSDLLLRGDPDAVRAHTREVLETMKPGGGYICGPDQWMPNYPPENLQALFSTATEHGRY